MNCIAQGAVLTGLCFLPAITHASTLSGYTYQVECQNFAGQPEYDRSCSTANNGYYSWSTQASVAQGSNSTSASASSSLAQLTATAALGYDFEIDYTGSGVPTTVPFFIFGSATVSETNGYAVAGISLVNTQYQQSVTVVNLCAGESFPGRLDPGCVEGSAGATGNPWEEIVQPGTRYAVSVGSRAFTWGAGSASASVDPFVEIDPNFLAANPGYTLTLGPNVQNTPPPVTTPEPGGLAGICCAVALLLSCRRTSR